MRRMTIWALLLAGGASATVPARAAVGQSSQPRWSVGIAGGHAFPLDGDPSPAIGSLTAGGFYRLSRLFSLGLEGGYHRYNDWTETWRQALNGDRCQPGDLTGGCAPDQALLATDGQFTQAWQLTAALRLAPGTGVVRPYVVVGAGAYGRRSQPRYQLQSPDGTILLNAPHQGTHLYSGGNVGAGLEFRPRGLPVALTAGGRLHSVLALTSDGPLTDGWATVEVGVRLD